MSTRGRTPPYEIVRSTCSAFQTDRVRVDPKAAEAFAKELDVEMVKKFGGDLSNHASSSGCACTFDSVEAEAAFTLLLHAMNFGSGWRHQLHKHHGKGAFLSIKPGVENFYNVHRKLGSEELMHVSKEEIAQHFGFEGNPELQNLVDLLQSVVVELGTKTKEFGSLTAFMTKKISTISKDTPAGDLVWDLVENFPDTFDDCYTVNDQHVCLYKKAQLVVGELYHRFHSEDPRFAFADGRKLTAYIDNVVCASLRYKKVIVPCPELNEMIENNVEILKGSEDEVALRSAAMVGVEAVVNVTPLSSMDLDLYLWAAFGKAQKVRKFQRHATRTVFY